MKKQVLVIGGGDTFDTYDEYISYLKDFQIDFTTLGKKGWKENLALGLGDDFEVIAPRMPSNLNAKYIEWKIWFDKYIPYLRDGVILIGYSLGGTFLAKYLSENDFPLEIKGTFLIAPAYDNEGTEYSMGDFVVNKNLDCFSNQSSNITLYQSEDDPIVPFTNMEKFKNALSKSRTVVFKDRGHFWQEEFIELVNDIKNIN